MIMKISNQHDWGCAVMLRVQHSICPVPTQGDIGCEGQAKLPQRRTQVLVSRQISCYPLIWQGPGSQSGHHLLQLLGSSRW